MHSWAYGRVHSGQWCEAYLFHRIKKWRYPFPVMSVHRFEKVNPKPIIDYHLYEGKHK